jgi:dTDP-4-dehydrorhamnose reductase
VFHIGGGTPISWYDYARLIFEVAGLQPSITATTSREYRTAARRPRYSALANVRMEALGIEPMPPLRIAVEHYLEHRKNYLL